MAGVLWGGGVCWEEDSQEDWSCYPGRPFCPLAMCNRTIFVLNLLLIADMFSEPWHLVSHSLMGKQSFNDISNCISLSWSSPCILQALTANPVFDLVKECCVVLATSPGDGRIFFSFMHVCFF